MEIEAESESEQEPKTVIIFGVEKEIEEEVEYNWSEIPLKEIDNDGY